jgi:hypothetical protein
VGEDGRGLRPAHRHAVAQRVDEQAGVDAAVARDVERQADGRGERRLPAARLGRQETVGVQAEARAVGVQAVQRLGVVAVARDHQRAGFAQPDAQVAGERLVPARALEPQAHERVVAVVGFGDRRQHARRDVPRAGLAVVEDQRVGAPLLRAARDRQPDDAAADDQDIREALHCDRG